MTTLVDTNILLDVFQSGSPWQSWSNRQLETVRRAGPVVINPIILAELATGFPTSELLNAALSPARFQREDLPWEAAVLVGKAFLAYRRSGGDKRSLLPDFYIGAHATAGAHRLLTRDASRYRAYFPALHVIAPDTHS